MSSHRKNEQLPGEVRSRLIARRVSLILKLRDENGVQNETLAQKARKVALAKESQSNLPSFNEYSCGKELTKEQLVEKIKLKMAKQAKKRSKKLKMKA